MLLNWRRWSCAALVSLGPLYASPACAIVSSNDPGDWTAGSITSNTGLSSRVLDAVGRLDIDGVGCSGSLLSGGAYVLTAAHCVTDSAGTLTANIVQIAFNNGVTASVTGSARISVFNSWDGALGNNNDLALLKLDAPITNMTGYSFYTGSFTVGETVLLAGYGYVGDGTTGYIATGLQSTVHWGENQYDFQYDSGTALWDFDSGTTDNNSLALMSIHSSTGLGALEGDIAPGDSGGPSLMRVGNQLYLTGVHSFIASPGVGAGTSSSTLNSSYGQLGADTVLSSANRSWINGRVSALPEPPVSWLCLSGLLLLGWHRRRF